MSRVKASNPRTKQQPQHLQEPMSPSNASIHTPRGARPMARATPSTGLPGGSHRTARVWQTRFPPCHRVRHLPKDSGEGNYNTRPTTAGAPKHHGKLRARTYRQRPAAAPHHCDVAAQNTVAPQNRDRRRPAEMQGCRTGRTKCREEGDAKTAERKAQGNRAGAEDTP